MDELHQNRLVQEAVTLIKRHFKRNRHHVASVLLSRSGKIYPGLHIDSHGFDMCAEPIALGQAIMAEDKDLLTIVSVFWDGTPEREPVVVAPCGNCRQILSEYAPTLGVLVPSDQGIKRVLVHELLPHAYIKP